MYHVYILASLLKDKYYIGHTANIENRINLHNKGKVRSTKSLRPWKLVYKEVFFSKNEAYKRELKIKSYKGGEAFKKLFKK